MKLRCFKCATEIEIAERVGRGEECDSCHSDLHCCKNCDFFDEKTYNQCREPSADVVKEKERANFCDYFTPSMRNVKAGKSQNDLLAAAEALFKKK